MDEDKLSNKNEELLKTAEKLEVSLKQSTSYQANFLKLSEQSKSTLKEMTKGTKELNISLKNSMSRITGSLASNLKNIFNGNFSGPDFNHMIKKHTQGNFSKMLNNYVSGLGGNLSSFSSNSNSLSLQQGMKAFLGKSFAKNLDLLNFGRSIGGNLGGGTPYIVGEKGPEIFIPNSGGSLKPNGSNIGGAINVTMNINTPNAQSFKESKTQLMSGFLKELGKVKRYL